MKKKRIVEGHKVLIILVLVIVFALFFLVKSALDRPYYDSVSEYIKEDLSSKMKESGELFIFNKDNLTAKIGKPVTLYLGIKNVASNKNNRENSVCFTLEIICELGLINTCTKLGNNQLVGGVSKGIINGTESTEAWFTSLKAIDIKPDDVGLIPVKFQISNGKPDTYLLNFNIYQYEGSCQNHGALLETPYATKDFFLHFN